MTRRRGLLVLAGAAVAARAATAATAATATSEARAASAGCPAVAGPLELNIVANSFPALQHVARIATACSRSGLKVSFKLTPQARTEAEQAFGSAGRSAFDAAVVSMSVFSGMYARRELQPLDDLVRKHGERYRIEEKMLVRVGGEVMAIAFLQNTQNLVYRADLLQRHGLAVPATYAELREAARVLQQREPGLPYPVAQGFAKGLDCAIEFSNLLASLGGRPFEPGSARPAFQGAAGVAAVETMRSMLPLMSPNALASNADDVVNQFQQGRAALGVLWASRASRMDDPAASRVAGQVQFAAAPAARAGGRSAAHLWWDGVVLPRNAPQHREAVFQVLMEALGEDSVRSGNDLGIWVRSVYRPGRFGGGVALQLAAGSPVWPSEPFFGLALGELGKVLPDALTGRRPVPEVLADAAAAYRRAAMDKGWLPAGA